MENIRPLSEEVISDNGKGSLFYRVHPYPTKVPPSINRKLISHYTKPGELVLDPFCGSGSTGYAAKLEGRDFYVSDLSPYAVHIARGYTESCSPEKVDEAVKSVFEALQDLRELYNVECEGCETDVKGKYWIWSKEYSCSECENKWTLNPDEGRKGNGKVVCPECETQYPQNEASTGKDIPLKVAYKCKKCHGKTVEKDLDKETVEELIQMEEEKDDSSPYARPMMNIDSDSEWGDQYRSGNHDNVESTASFFTGRNWKIFCELWEEINEIETPEVKHSLQFAFTASLYTASNMVRCRPKRDGRSNNPGTLYLPPLFLEQNIFKVFNRRIKKIKKLKKELKEAESQAILSENGLENRSGGKVDTADAQNLDRIDDESVDFIVTDPPFGDSLQYAELNFIPESFLDSFTESDREIVVNETRETTEEDYLEMMGESFEEMYRVLKPERYLCLVFNNTDPLVWAGIKRKLLEAGFDLKKVTGIVKGHASKNQTVYSGSTSRFDPIFHLRKPSEGEKLQDVKELSKEESREKAVSVASEVLKEGRESKEDYKTSLAYIHSMVTRRLLEKDAIISPPSPKKLRKLLENEDSITFNGGE